MKEQMKSDEDKFYWVEEGEESIELFEKFQSEQSFYINDKGNISDFI